MSCLHWIFLENCTKTLVTKPWLLNLVVCIVLIEVVSQFEITSVSVLFFSIHQDAVEEMINKDHPSNIQYKACVSTHPSNRHTELPERSKQRRKKELLLCLRKPTFTTLFLPDTNSHTNASATCGCIRRSPSLTETQKRVVIKIKSDMKGRLFSADHCRVDAARRPVGLWDDVGLPGVTVQQRSKLKTSLTSSFFFLNCGAEKVKFDWIQSYRAPLP